MTIFRDIGQYLLMLGGMISRPENAKMYWKEFIHQCSEIGIGSLGIVVIISIFMGAVSTVQTAYQLVSPLIPLSVIAQVVRDTVILEFAPTLVCIVLAGVVVSKIASELGNMRVSEQIDALEIMGINSKTYLVLPKNYCSISGHPNACDNCWCPGNLGRQVSWFNDRYCPSSYIRPGTIRGICPLQCDICFIQSVHICFYYFKYLRLLWLLCKGWCLRNRKSKYKSSSYKLHHDLIC